MYSLIFSFFLFFFYFFGNVDKSTNQSTDKTKQNNKDGKKPLIGSGKTMAVAGSSKSFTIDHILHGGAAAAVREVSCSSSSLLHVDQRHKRHVEWTATPPWMISNYQHHYSLPLSAWAFPPLHIQQHPVASSSTYHYSSCAHQNGLAHYNHPNNSLFPWRQQQHGKSASSNPMFQFRT